MPEAPDGVCVYRLRRRQRHLLPALHRRPERLPGLPDEHRQRRVEALARGRAVQRSASPRRSARTATGSRAAGSTTRETAGRPTSTWSTPGSSRRGGPPKGPASLSGGGSGYSVTGTGRDRGCGLQRLALDLALADQPEGQDRAGEAEQRAERQHVVEAGEEALARRRSRPRAGPARAPPRAPGRGCPTRPPRPAGAGGRRSPPAFRPSARCTLSAPGADEDRAPDGDRRPRRRPGGRCR